MFGNIKNVSWVTNIMLLKEREHQIRSCFNFPVELFYPQNVSEFNIVIENFQRKKEKKSDNDSIFGENNKFDKLIVMYNDPGLADRSKDFRSFLSINRKFNFTCVYVFHIMHPSKLWQIIIS